MATCRQHSKWPLYAAITTYQHGSRGIHQNYYGSHLTLIRVRASVRAREFIAALTAVQKVTDGFEVVIIS